jgi:hypothetical protein
MITPPHMLNAIRRELATRVLPAVTDDRARSSVIAAMGILGDLALQVSDDEAWLEDSLALLEPAVARWDLRVGPADLAETPAQRRDRLLAGIESLVERLWRTGADPGRLREVRTVLLADLELQLKRIR